MDIFEYMREQNMQNESPLASRLRPNTLEEVVGQQHIIAETVEGSSKVPPSRR